MTPPPLLHCPSHLSTLAIVLFIIAINISSNPTTAFHHVFAGTGALEVQLIAAKLALKAGDTCSIVGPADEGSIKKCLALMYGLEVARTYGEDGGESMQRLPEFVSDGDAIGRSLAKADYISILCEDKGVDDDFVNTLLSNAPKVQHVVLLSKHGGKLKSTEDSIRNKCIELSKDSSGSSNANVCYSVIRAGTLVGGGPGPEKENGEEWGLSKYFYDTKYDLSDAMITQSMDKFTMGARVTPGDPFKAPNFFAKMMSNSSFEPRDGDTGRTAAAQAVLAALRRVDGGVDVSISTEKAKSPPSDDDWNSLLGTQ